jgi:GntR family transcriptional regulator, transcriptional repressor for pyruvate dehydrogenase complex
MAIGHKQVAAQVGSHLRELAMKGELKPGDRLPSERQLARELSISRSSLREGINHLATFGVLKSVHSVGTFVATGLHQSPLSVFGTMHEPDQAQMFEMRLVLEPDIASLAAERATAKQIAELANVLTEIKLSTGRPDIFWGHDLSFHRTVAAASGNTVLRALIEGLKKSPSYVRSRDGASVICLKQLAETHHNIFSAIRAHDPAWARSAMEQHLGLCHAAMSSTR